MNVNTDSFDNNFPANFLNWLAGLLNHAAETVTTQGAPDTPLQGPEDQWYK